MQTNCRKKVVPFSYHTFTFTLLFIKGCPVSAPLASLLVVLPPTPTPTKTITTMVVFGSLHPARCARTTRLATTALSLSITWTCTITPCTLPRRSPFLPLRTLTLFAPRWTAGSRRLRTSTRRTRNLRGGFGTTTTCAPPPLTLMISLSTPRALDQRCLPLATFCTRRAHLCSLTTLDGL